MMIDNSDIKVLGFKGVIDSVEDTLSEINSFKDDDSIVQLLNADAIAGKQHVIHGINQQHVIHGINQAFLAFGRDENFADDLGVEICVRCSAQKQISKSFKILGLKEGEMNLCAVLINCSDEIVDKLSSMFTRDDDVLIADNSILQKIYSISDDELDNICMEDVIIDKITKLIVDY